MPRPSGNAWNLVNPEQVESARQAAQQQYKEQLERSERERAEAEAAGVPALRRLVDVAQGDTDQPRHVRRFLLGLYSGTAWPFDLQELRCLSMDLQADCLAVLRMDLQPRCEVQRWIQDGEALWRWMANVESGEVESNE
jgi:hypothetical protein